MSLVLDSSVAVAWIYADEATEAVLNIFERMMKQDQAWIPALWRWEVANALQMNIRRGRHGAAFRDEALSNLACLPIKVDAQAEPEVWLGALVMAERYGLTLYDAAYLEIAVRRKIPLATLDRQLRAAARDENVELPSL